jgi:hypothetical protein
MPTKKHQGHPSQRLHLLLLRRSQWFPAQDLGPPRSRTGSTLVALLHHLLSLRLSPPTSQDHVSHWKEREQYDEYHEHDLYDDSRFDE